MTCDIRSDYVVVFRDGATWLVGSDRLPRAIIERVHASWRAEVARRRASGVSLDLLILRRRRDSDVIQNAADLTDAATASVARCEINRGMQWRRSRAEKTRVAL